MRIGERLTARLIGGSLALALLVPSCALALPAPQNADSNQQGGEAGQTAPAQAQPAPAQPAAQELPNSPGAAQAQATGGDKGGIAATPQPAQPVPPPPQNSIQKPVGTAAAETATTTGFAAARPAGAALAPAKQRRVRTILISVGAVVGAAVALGTVAALSKATPSRPPGANR